MESNFFQPHTPVKFEFVKTFQEHDLKTFAALSSDDNPLHLDPDYAAGTVFKKPVVHGVLLLGMFSRIFGNQYPGRGSVYLSQSAEFLRPAYLNQEIKAVAELSSYDQEKRIGVFKTECFNEAGKRILSGKAEVLFPEGFFPEDGDAEKKRSGFLRRPSS